MSLHPHHHAKTTPDKPAYIMAGSGEVVTYRQLEDRSNQGAQLFRKLGLQKGDTVALLIENSPRFVEVCFAAQRAGLFFTAMSTRLSPSEAAYILGDCGAKALIASAALAPAARDALGETPTCGHLYFVDGAPEGGASWEAARDRMPAEMIPDQAAGRDMLYSSGTTGRPKGIKVQPADDEAFDAPPRIMQFVQGVYGGDANSVYLAPAPLYHAAPLRFTMGFIRAGGTAVVMEKFDAERALDLIERHRVTHSQWVPSMFVRMLKLPAEARAGRDLSSHRCAIHAAAPCPVSVKRQMIDWWGPILNEYYAGTEGNGFVACDSEQWLRHPGTVGCAVSGEIRILDENDDPLPPGEANVGGVFFAEAPVFEYHNDPEKTASSRSKQGWTTLGDVGYINEEGYLFLTDRKANMIISGGVNIYPQEVENLLIGHPKVADVAVFGVPNEDFGEEVKAVVQPADMAEAGEALGAELIAYCLDNISRIKCPRSVDFMAELPRHPTGKLYKRLLRDKYWEGHGNKLV